MATYLIKNGANQISPNTLVRGSNSSSGFEVDWQVDGTSEARVRAYAGTRVTVETLWDSAISSSAYAHIYIRGRGSNISTGGSQYFKVGSTAKDISETNTTYKWDISSSTVNPVLYCSRNVSSSGNYAVVYVSNMWLTKDITLTYDANNGSGAPSDATAEEGTTVTLSSTVPTRTGYTFGGWNTKADGTGTNYASGASYTMPTANVTLYAKWTIKTYTVSISAGEGTTITFDGVAYTNTTTSITKNYGTYSYSIAANDGWIISTRSPASDGTMTVNSAKSLSATGQRVGCRIYNGSSYDQYTIHIYNGSSWDMYQAYIWDGSEWQLMN